MASMADVSAFKYININMYLPVVLVVHCAMVILGVDKCGGNYLVLPVVQVVISALAMLYKVWAVLPDPSLAPASHTVA